MAHAPAPGRLVVVGRNSAVWKRLAPLVQGRGATVLAIGHADAADQRLDAADRVWIFSYSRIPEENVRLLEQLRGSGAARVFYLSTATANVADAAPCYTYPRAKRAAEDEAQTRLGAEIVRIGLAYLDEAELPAGTNAATHLRDLAACMLTSGEPKGGITNLFRMAERPFRGAGERGLHRLYGRLLRAAGSRPCLLRPLDLLLKTLGLRWYGYLYLSNLLWLRDPPARAKDRGPDLP